MGSDGEHTVSQRYKELLFISSSIIEDVCDFKDYE